MLLCYLGTLWGTFPHTHLPVDQLWGVTQWCTPHGAVWGPKVPHAATRAPTEYIFTNAVFFQSITLILYIKNDFQLKAGSSMDISGFYRVDPTYRSFTNFQVDGVCFRCGPQRKTWLPLRSLYMSIHYFKGFSWSELDKHRISWFQQHHISSA